MGTITSPDGTFYAVYIYPAEDPTKPGNFDGAGLIYYSLEEIVDDDNIFKDVMIKQVPGVLYALAAGSIRFAAASAQTIQAAENLAVEGRAAVMASEQLEEGIDEMIP